MIFHHTFLYIKQLLKINIELFVLFIILDLYIQFIITNMTINY